MRVTSHLAGKTTATTNTKRRFTETIATDNDEDDTVTSNSKRQKTRATTTTTTRRTTSSTAQNNTTPSKNRGKQTNSNLQTPRQSTKALLHQKESPKTPYEIRTMMALEKEEDEVKPIYDTESLHITELHAFKVDHTAYNSYLYTGKLKIPINSNIAREDYATSVGASVGKNIKIHLKPKNMSKISFNLDSDDEEEEVLHTDNDNDTSDENSPPNSLTAIGAKIKNRRATAYATQSLVSKDGSNVCLTDSPIKSSKRGMTTRTMRTRTQQLDWDFSLEEHDEDDYVTDSEDDFEDDETYQDSNATGFPDNFDESEYSLFSESDNDGEDDDYSTDTEAETISKKGKINTVTKKLPSKQQNTGRNTRRNTTSDIVDDSDDNDEDDVDSKGKRQPNNQRKDATNAKPTQTPKNITKTLNALVNQSQYRRQSQRLTPTPVQTTPGEEFQIVNIVVKYPLMGSLDDWKDSFQTCQEEVVMYRQIQTWKCPFLLRYYGSHGPGLVFEYVDGESLDSLLFHATDVDIEQQTWMWSELGFHVSTALLYLHKLNISHNDIKPENVRYSATKQCWKLLDLGLATDFDMKVSRQIGTDGYRSPEVAKSGRLNRKSDVYSLGIMMDDALERLVKRYQVLEDIYDDFEDVRQQYEEERKTKAYKQKGEIDLDSELTAILTTHIKRRKMDSIPITLENARYTITQGAKYVSFLELSRELLKAMMSENPEDRPSVKRCLACFKTMMTIETQLRDCLSTLKLMGIY